MLTGIALFVATFARDGGVARLMHRYLMHGPLWVLHESHHRPRQSAWFELNDLFGILFAIPSIVLIYLGTHGHPLLLAVGLGMTAYGAPTSASTTSSSTAASATPGCRGAPTCAA
jgi:beta-carotene 3-hydroxylase